MKDSAYSLRPHHGLCLQFFQGKGYSEEFVENMKKIVDTLGENPQIRLVSGADALCRCCPNRVGESDCKSDEKVRGYDQSVLDLCSLDEGEVLPWEEFSSRVTEKILEKRLRENVCGDCQWTDICQ